MYHRVPTKARKKRKHSTGGVPIETKIGKGEIKKVPTRGGKFKVKRIATKYANVLVDGKNSKCEITGLESNSANKDYMRRKIITKGAILSAKTPSRKDLTIKVTSRPGQDGIVNAISL